MDDKEYRSIGETLELLKREFPEITISKIRFLETQGLIAPERTTNGYRKFYDHDIERLSFVLRQQREQFLPLKVIKDRITEKEPGVFVLDPNKGRFSASPKAKNSKFERDIFGDPIQQVTPGLKSKPKPQVQDEGLRPQHAGTSAHSQIAIHTQHSSDGFLKSSSSTNSKLNDTNPQNKEAAPAKVKSPSAKADKQSPLTTNPAPQPASTKRPRLFALPSASPLAEKLDEYRIAHNHAEELIDPDSQSDAEDETTFPKNSFTSREIAELADLTMVQLNDLTTFGLLCPTSVRGQQIYSSADLELAILAREFARFGLEARHLKMYKVSADREASFLEQVVLPILANKSTKSRAKAEAALTQLGEIGARFRTQLLERAIDKILNS